MKLKLFLNHRAVRRTASLLFTGMLSALLLMPVTGCGEGRKSRLAAIPPVKKLKTMNITVGGKTVVAEIAATPQHRTRGLMFRAKMGADEGMLFVFPRPQVQGFWMKNTLIPLDIGYFNEDGLLIKVLTMYPQPGVPDHQLKTYGSGGPALYALEMNKGWFKKNRIIKYMRLKLPRPVKGL